MADPSPLPIPRWEIWDDEGVILPTSAEALCKCGIEATGQWVKYSDIAQVLNAHAALVEALRKFTSDGTFTLDDLLHARALLKELDTK